LCGSPAGTLPDGGKGLAYTTRYGLVGANALGMNVILDGVNDQGLSVGLFYFPVYAKYAEATKKNAAHAIAPHEFGLWVFANFASVDEVIAGLKDVTSCRPRRRASAARKAWSQARISSSRTGAANRSRSSPSTT
jgi:penicillin V acylase-like amidase (Ntn superfamily)